MDHFLSTAVLLDGGPYRLPLQVQRLLEHLGFADVRLIDGPHDKGGDLIAAKGHETFVFQCKWKRRGEVAASAVDETEGAKRHYSRDRAILITNSTISRKARRRIDELKGIGTTIEPWDGATLRRLFDALSEYSAAALALRDYQGEAVAALRNDLETRSRAMLVLATGLGKTVVGGEVIRHHLENETKDEVLVVAHLKELVQQLERATWAHLPKQIKTQVLTGDTKPADLAGVTFATVESAMGAVLDGYRPKLVMVDETHHVSESGTFQRLLDSLEDSAQFGVTATPWRGDRFDITERFGPASFTMGIAEGMARGWLAQVDYRLFVDNIDWDAVRAASHHRYSIKELNETLFLPQRDEAIVGHLVEAYNRIVNPRGVVFCQTIEHAERFAESLRDHSAQWRNVRCLHSALTKPERQHVLAEFRLGRIPVLTVRDIFNEGVDVPDINLILFLRITHSRRIFVQQLGRGLRLKRDGRRVVVLDFVTDIRRAAAALGIKREMERLSSEEVVTVNEPATIEFSDARAGSLLDAWIQDAADLETSAEEVQLEFPETDWSVQ